MKFFAVIMAFYLSALALVPCTDGPTHSDGCETVIVLDDHHEHDHTHEGQDHCTPFCTCTCCGATVVIPTGIGIPLVKLDLSFVYQFYYLSGYSFEFQEGVWHPPALA